MTMAIVADFFPLTGSADFVKASAEPVALKLEEFWRERFEKEGTVRRASPITTGLGRALKFLDPASDPVTRALVLCTRQKEWSAIYFNTMDLQFSAAALLAQRLRVDALSFRVMPHTIQKKGGKVLGRYGVVRFSYFSSNGTREMSLVNDMGKWRFGERGDPRPFEDTKSYSARRVEDRFTPPMLVKYLDSLGLRPFDDDFFVVDSKHPAHGREFVPTDAEDYDRTSVEELRADAAATAEWLAALQISRGSKGGRAKPRKR